MQLLTWLSGDECNADAEGGVAAPSLAPGRSLTYVQASAVHPVRDRLFVARHVTIMRGQAKSDHLQLKHAPAAPVADEST